MTDKVVQWFDHGREPKVAPNPAYPDGIDLDVTHGAEASCLIPLPYPAERCGMFIIVCKTCHTTTTVTTAGRSDDPRSIKIPCKQMRQ